VKILLACPYAWDTAGGVQAHVRQLAAALDERGHQVVTVAPARSPGGDDPSLRLVGRTVGIAWGGTVVPLCCSYRSLRSIRRLIGTFRPDVVHVHEPFAPSTSMLVTLAAPAPVVATFHAFSERARILEAAAPLLRIVARRIAVPLAVSESAAELAGRVLPGRVAIVPNGVGTSRFDSRGPLAAGVPDGRVVLWVHRLEPRKGFAVAVRAFAQLATALDDAHLVVVGDGRDRDALGLLSDRHRRRVVMLGAVSDAALPRYHAAADVFVAPATGQESFGIALIEAMAAALPVVASDIRGYRGVVRHGIEGLLVPPNDPGALAAALRRVLTEPMLAATLGRAGRERARRYSWDVVAPKLEAIYARVAPARWPGGVEPSCRATDAPPPPRRAAVSAA
jgi:phosphatidyl-myo-inositol alpha-mannosyltransferase